MSATGHYRVACVIRGCAGHAIMRATDDLPLGWKERIYPTTPPTRVWYCPEHEAKPGDGGRYTKARRVHDVPLERS